MKPGLDSNPYRQGVIHLANNFTCGRNFIMGDIVKYSGPYLFPFVIEYSLIAAAILFAMWRNIGKNPRFEAWPFSNRSILIKITQEAMLLQPS